MASGLPRHPNDQLTDLLSAMVSGPTGEPREWREAVSAEHDASLRKSKDDPVNHPKHYTAHPSGVECVQIAEHMGFNLGNALKYIWRADLKGNAIEDLEKAVWYVNREMERRRKA